MKKLIGFLALGLAACGSGTGNAATVDSATPGATSTSAARVPSGRAPVSVARIESSSLTLARGAAIEVTINSGITSRHNNAGDVIEAHVTSDVLDSRGRVAIPAGSPVEMHIASIKASPAGHPNAEGALELNITSLTVRGERHSENMSTSNIPHSMKGRGLTKGQGEDLAVGTAVGALAGQIIGKNTKSTVIGGAVGAVAGGAVAVAGAQSDIVVAPGTRVMFTLSQSMTVAGR